MSGYCNACHGAMAALVALMSPLDYVLALALRRGVVLLGLA